MVEAATEPYNASSDSICLVGNCDAFPMTKSQRTSLTECIKRGQKRDKLIRNLTVAPHRKVAAKACPGRFVSDQMLAEIQSEVRR